MTTTGGTFPHTVGRRVRLRPGTRADGPDFHRLMRHLDLGPVPEQGKFLDAMTDSLDAFFVIAGRADGATVGYTTLSQLALSHVRFGIWAEPSGARLGADAEAALLTINYAFANWPVRKVYRHSTTAGETDGTVGGTFASISQLEATLPGHQLARGRLWETRIHAIYRDDWLRRGAPLIGRLVAHQDRARHGGIMADYESVRDFARELLSELFAGQADGALVGNRASIDTSAIRVTDLDSFSLVELVLAIETEVGVPILNDLADFPGGTVDDLAAFAVRVATGHAPGGAQAETASEPGTI